MVHMPQRKPPNNRPSIKQREAMGLVLNRAIQEVGSSTDLARALKITLQAISRWEICPPNRCIAVERACGREVTRYELRPDVFGDGTDV